MNLLREKQNWVEQADLTRHTRSVLPVRLGNAATSTRMLISI